MEAHKRLGSPSSSSKHELTQQLEIKKPKKTTDATKQVVLSPSIINCQSMTKHEDDQVEGDDDVVIIEDDEKDNDDDETNDYEDDDDSSGSEVDYFHEVCIFITFPASFFKHVHSKGTSVTLGKFVTLFFFCCYPDSNLFRFDFFRML